MSDTVENFARDQLRSFVDRIERLEEEKKTTADDIKDVYSEAKGVGLDPKILRKVISLRKQDPDERAEAEAVLDLYLDALGMSFQPRLPFGDESVRTVEPKATMQIFTGDGTPLTPPMDLAAVKAAGEAVKAAATGKPKRTRKPAKSAKPAKPTKPARPRTDDADEQLRQTRAQGPEFA